MKYLSYLKDTDINPEQENIIVPFGIDYQYEGHPFTGNLNRCENKAKGTVNSVVDKARID